MRKIADPLLSLGSRSPPPRMGGPEENESANQRLERRC